MDTLRDTFTHSMAQLGLACWLILTASTSMASAPTAAQGQSAREQKDREITMTGRCPNGDSYRLISYEKEVEGYWKSFYDYQGPVGVGTVKTQTAPRVMVSRVCIALAEIASDE
jgi:hypothetical protein